MSIATSIPKPPASFPWLFALVVLAATFVPSSFQTALAAEPSPADKARYHGAINEFMGNLGTVIFANERKKGEQRGPKEMVAAWSKLYDDLIALNPTPLPREMRAEFNRILRALQEQIAIMKSVPDNELEGLLYFIQSAEKGEYDFDASKLDADIRAKCARTHLEMKQGLEEVIAIANDYGIDVR